MPKKTIFNPAQRRCSDAVIILGYSDAIKLQRRSTDAVTELVLRCCVYWPNRLGWRQKVLQLSSTFMILSWWCPLGHGKWHLPAIQFILAVRLIPILTHLSSRWTVPLRHHAIFSVRYSSVQSPPSYLQYLIITYGGERSLPLRFSGCCRLLRKIRLLGT